MKSLSYLHLSDLHMGLGAQMSLMSKFKNDFFEDIKKLYKKTGKWDIVFFTGDFVQSGRVQEFEKVSEFLHELWNIFNQLGFDPYFIGVPGNHDLERGDDPFNSNLKVLLNWEKENDIKENLFWLKENEYLNYINERFKNYVTWYGNLQIKKPETVLNGYLPGDFAYETIINGISLGCVCLNSAYLQLDNKDYEGKLEITGKQIFSIFKDKYAEWLNRIDLPLLLTHHSTNWLTTESSKIFNSEIYFPDKSYINHLCGHLHESQVNKFGSFGSNTKYIQVASSLFGLEKYQDKETRTHGYFAGKYEINEELNVQHYLWPRIMTEQKSGYRKIVPDFGFPLNDDTLCCNEIVRTIELLDITEDVDHEIKSKEIEQIDIPNSLNDGDNLFESKLIPTDDLLSRTFYNFNLSHSKIRTIERAKAIELLLTKKYVWIVTKWGLGEDGFIGTIMHETEICQSNCFSINCEDVTNKEELIKTFDNFFQIPFNKYIDIISKLENPLLIFNKINRKLFETTSTLNKLQDLIQLILDFAPNLKIIVVSENIPNLDVTDYIELLELDPPNVRLYASVYNLKELELDNANAIEKLYTLSSGLPNYLDSYIDQLKFCSLSDLIIGEYENNDLITNKENNTSTTKLNRIINQLRNSTEDIDKKSYDLLEILGLLHNGEIYERIKHFNSNMSFFPSHVSRLEKSSLIEITSINSISFTNKNESQILKIIKVPRPVRDIVCQMIDDNKKELIYKTACDIYLGKKWREGVISNNKPSSSELSNIIYANSNLSIRYLLIKAIKTENYLEIDRLANVAITFCNSLANQYIYKDSATFAEEMYNLLPDSSKRQKVYIAKLYGESLRMNDELVQKAINILLDVLKEGDSFLSKNEKAEINLELAYSYKKLGIDHKKESIFHSNKVKEYSQKDSSRYIASEAVIFDFIENKEEKIRKLKTLVNKAKNKGYDTTYHNLSIILIKLYGSYEYKKKQLNDIINSGNSTEYNLIRTIINKFELLIAEEKFNDFLNLDVILIYKAYTYLFYQSLYHLFNRCHSVIWNYSLNCNNYFNLMNLFRYSSFVWRIAGNESEEQKYLNLEIPLEYVELMQKEHNSIFNLNYNYYLQRKNTLVNNIEYQLASR